MYCVSNYPSDTDDFNLNNIKILIKPIDRNKTKEVKPKVTPRMWGIVFIIPKLNPEYEATTLLGPGVYAVTNQNSAIDNISGCIYYAIGKPFLDL